METSNSLHNSKLIPSGETLIAQTINLFPSEETLIAQPIKLVPPEELCDHPRNFPDKYNRYHKSDADYFCNQKNQYNKKICANCGKMGHEFKSCLDPITSYGVINIKVLDEPVVTDESVPKVDPFWDEYDSMLITEG